MKLLPTFLGLLLYLTSVSGHAEISDTRTVAQRFLNDFWNARNIDGINEFVDPDLTIFGPSNRMQGRKISADEMQAFRHQLQQAMPDLQYSLEDLIVEGNKAVLRVTAKFTHTRPAPAGPFGLAEPTGNQVVYAVIFILEVVDGRLVRVWDIPDNLNRFRAMGAFPALQRETSE